MDERNESGPVGRETRRAEFARALVAGEFFLVYQPVLDLSRGSFTGVEALMRWRHDGVVRAPSQFLGDLENSGLIAAVGRWALTTACQQASEWHSRGYRLSVSVNVSALQLHDASLIDDVAIALGASRLAPRSLILEIDANDARDESAQSTLSSLVELGVRIAVDDVDPTSDSLASFSGGLVSIVKLERGAIARLMSSADEIASLHALLDVAREQRLAVVATGVEDVEQRRLLLGEHVASAQGFLFSAPREAHEIDNYLQGFSIFSGEPL